MDFLEFAADGMELIGGIIMAALLLPLAVVMLACFLPFLPFYLIYLLIEEWGNVK